MAHIYLKKVLKTFFFRLSKKKIFFFSRDRLITVENNLLFHATFEHFRLLLKMMFISSCLMELKSLKLKGTKF